LVHIKGKEFSCGDLLPEELSKMSNFDKIDFGYLFDLLPNIPKPNVSPVRV
jgi:hypothetical protein